jgi:hypothetical protein
MLTTRSRRPARRRGRRRRLLALASLRSEWGEVSGPGGESRSVTASVIASPPDARCVGRGLGPVPGRARGRPHRVQRRRPALTRFSGPHWSSSIRRTATRGSTGHPLLSPWWGTGRSTTSTLIERALDDGVPGDILEARASGAAKPRSWPGRCWRPGGDRPPRHPRGLVRRAPAAKRTVSRRRRGRLSHPSRARRVARAGPGELPPLRPARRPGRLPPGLVPGHHAPASTPRPWPCAASTGTSTSPRSPPGSTCTTASRRAAG